MKAKAAVEEFLAGAAIDVLLETFSNMKRWRRRKIAFGIDGRTVYVPRNEAIRLVAAELGKLPRVQQTKNLMMRRLLDNVAVASRPF